jgi:DNA modification methylase
MLENIPGGSIDLAVLDPPYGCRYVANHRKVLPDAEMLANDDQPRTEFIPPIVRTVKSGGAVYLCTRYDVMPLWSDALKNAGAKLKVPIVWDKCTHSKGDLLGDYSNRVEFVLVAHVGLSRYRDKPIYPDL